MIFNGIIVLILALANCNALSKKYGSIPDNLDIEAGSLSVSGVSAGASMATQMQVAHSSTIKGAALFAGGGPYYCAQGSLTFALGRCMATPGNIPVEELIDDTERFAAAGDIDPTSNLQGSKIFIWHGAFDDTVLSGASVAIEQYYNHYGADVKFPGIQNFPAGHCQPVADEAGGVANEDCGATRSPYINNCEYDGAFKALNHIYNSTLTAPSRPVDQTGTLTTFPQNDYILNPSSVSLGDTGYIYTPTACNTETCKLHIALHGCLMDEQTINEDYVTHGGYNEVADANNIVILYPQTKRSLSIPYNPNGCFDWWGYNDGSLEDNYATQKAPQIEAIMAMADAVINGKRK